LAGLATVREALVAADADPVHAAALFHRHGDAAAAVVEQGAIDGELDRLVPHLPYLVTEVRWAARHEMACTLEDTLSRRLRVSVRDAAAGGAAIDVAASVLAEELGWDLDTTAARGVVPLR
jgi:glycerol-3-phosphate dehydrogenase